MPSHALLTALPWFSVQNGGAEACMAWVLSHMEDPDFNDPLIPPARAAPATAAAPDPEAVSTLQSMGFTNDQASLDII